MTAQNPTPDDLRTIAQNLQSEGHTSRAEVLRNVVVKLEAQQAVIDAARDSVYFQDRGELVSLNHSLHILSDVLKKLDGDQ